MDKYDYTDATGFLKSVGGQYGDTENRFNMLADKYY
jgi:hypothetical protein